MTDSIAARIHSLATRAKTAPPLVMLTAYDAISARIVDDVGVDLILVGDSAANTVLGYSTTREISVDELLMLTRAARRGVRSALLVGDLPFGTYESNDEQAVATARRFVEAGCDLVKLEGASKMLSRVAAIIAAGIPVMGHVGLLPQGAETVAALRARGRTANDAISVVCDAIALADAGCSILVVEAVPSVVAAAIVERVSIPVIGIGAGSNVGGQVLVLPDLLGLGDGPAPKFVQTYARTRESWIDAIQRFSADVRSRSFPVRSHEYGMPAPEVAAFQALLVADSPLGGLKGAG